ncbi:MAG: hypothetical protein K2P81_00980 [Bacteriovoracaceae bacterium]|nr:hypothetical protein [Bacteriovoracaceae bacterium]
MKNTILALILSLSSTLAIAQNDLEAKSFPALLEEIQQTNFTYIETGKMFGFVSTQSCMFRSSDLVVFKNYCYPARTYPAQGYTIISKNYGIIELYEEVMDSTLKRDILISEFPALLAPYLNSPIPSLGLSDFSLIIEKMYNLYLPGCWSTNYSFYTEDKDANCSKPVDGIIGFAQWAQETQAIVNDEAEWKALIKFMNAKFVK